MIASTLARSSIGWPFSFIRDAGVEHPFNPGTVNTKDKNTDQFALTPIHKPVSRSRKVTDDNKQPKQPQMLHTSYKCTETIWLCELYLLNRSENN